MTKVAVVNENDEIIGYKERNSLKQEDIYRISVLWITNSKGEILLSQRAFTKSHNPGKWGAAVAGTVEDDEDYDSNIVKEAEEELGLKNIEMKKERKVRERTGYNHFTQYYTAVVDKGIGEFKVNKGEVRQIKWINREEMILDIKNNPGSYLKLMGKVYKMFS